ncbi:ATP synthase subunit beta [Striga asiatica]|uniref:ATP synthase subunit beta n=1 Tax=Striga asiatica TaxID=4170 RepID=A0A5A7QTU7_STRAF|nr:ATP synthase subunit beta [Striga asiatica]
MNTTGGFPFSSPSSATSGSRNFRRKVVNGWGESKIQFQCIEHRERWRKFDAESRDEGRHARPPFPPNGCPGDPYRDFKDPQVQFGWVHGDCCPSNLLVSAVVLSNVLVDQSPVKRLTFRLMLVAKSSGLPLRPFVKHSCYKLSEVVVSATMCFPLFVTLSLLSKAVVIYSVDCTYSRKKFDYSKFYVIIFKIWSIVFTYMWVCVVISGCLTLFLVFLVVVNSVFLTMGFPPDLSLYPVMVVGFIFSIVIVNAIIMCNIGVVISVLEDVLGPHLLRSISLIFLGLAMGLAIVEGLFEHRVKTLSYGDGSSRIWEGLCWS